MKRVLSPLQKAYAKFFFDMLDKYGVETPAKLSDEKKSKFFKDIKSGWKNEVKEGKDINIREKATIIEAIIAIKQNNKICKIIREELKNISGNKRIKINESFKSDIIRDFTNSDLFKNKIRRLAGMWKLKWDEISDSDIIKTSPASARKKIHDFDIIIWYDSNNRPTAISRGKNVWYDEYQDAKHTSSKVLADESAHCLIIPYDVQTKYSAFAKSDIRHKSREGATALMKAEEIAEKNLRRYKSIIAKRHSENADIDEKIKGIMRNYQKTFEEMTSNQDTDIYKLYALSDKIKLMISYYADYIDIKKDLSAGSAYFYQTKRIEDIVRNVNKEFTKIK